MRSAVVAFAVVFTAGVIALLAFALLERSDEAFTLGVAPALPLEAGAGQQLCQGPIDVPADFDRAEVFPAESGERPRVVVRDARTGRTLDRPVEEGRRIEVCIEGPASVLGNAELAARSSEARLDDRPIKADLAVVFQRAEDRTLLALVPDIISRASLFHGSWIEPWLLALVGLLLVTAFPLLLAAALRESSR